MRWSPLTAIHEADVAEVAAGVVGIPAAALPNDFIVARGIDAFVPTLAQNHKTMRKLVDGGTTILCAAGAGAVVRHIFRKPTWAQWIQYTGTVFGGSRIATGVFQLFGLQYQLSEVTPIDAQIGNIYNPSHPAVQMAAAQAALPAGASGVTTDVYSAIPAAGSTGPGGLI